VEIVKHALIMSAVALAAVGSLAGCGSKSSHASGSSSSSSSCAAGFTSGKIDGQNKCLQPGQQCQQAEASQYKKYGFSCTKTNGRYALKKS
jgi:hypothetical protein